MTEHELISCPAERLTEGGHHPSSRAAEPGLRTGDVVQEVTSISDLNGHSANQKEASLLLVNRQGGSTLFVAV